jgi:hypothetical protein
VLGLIGEPRYLGADPGLAQLFYQAHLDVFLTALPGLLHATALVASAGVGVAEFLPGALDFLAAVPELLGEETVHRLESGDYAGGLSSVAMTGATADHIALSSEQAGIGLALPRAVRSHYERVLSAGGGAHDWTSIYEAIKAR